MRDFHSHSNYSDGQMLWAMVEAAEEAGLDGIGFTDHCMVPKSERLQRVRAAAGHTLDETYERRRRGIERVREESSIEIYDAVEMDYDPRWEDRIAAFLDDADFDYVVGSVHAVDDRSLLYAPNFADDTETERDAVVDRYFDELVAMIDSGLYDVLAHPDIIERNPHLRGRATQTQYERVADALTDARTVPELNAGRALREEDLVYPTPDFRETLVDAGLSFTLGTDSHDPGEYGPRSEFLTDFVADHDLSIVAPPSLE